MIVEFYEAYKGSLIWSRKGNKNNLYIFVPKWEKELLIYALKFSDALLKECKKKEVIYIVSEDVDNHMKEAGIDCKYKMITLSRKKANCLFRFFSLKINVMGESIFENVRFVSYDFPDVGAVRVLSENQIITLEYLVWNRMFHKQHEYVEAVE